MATYIKIASNTVGAGGVASVTFSSIPATYTDLVLKFSTRGSTTAIDSIYLSLNGLTTSFSSKYLQADGATPSSNSLARYASGITPSTYTANTFGNAEIYFPNYASSNYKSYSSDWTTENNATTSYLGFIAGLWSSTAAITSIGIVPNAGNFAQYSTFTLYGISNA